MEGDGELFEYGGRGGKLNFEPQTRSVLSDFRELPSISPTTSMMVAAGLEPFLKGDSGRNTRGLLRIIILCTIAAAAIASRLFSVIRKPLQS